MLTRKTAGIAEWLRVFRLLLYKDFLVRKRHWKSTVIIQLVLPFLVFIMCLAIRDLSSEKPKKVDHDTYDAMKSSKDLLEYYSKVPTLLYSPNNTETHKLMKKVQKCLAMKSKDILGLRNEDDLIKIYLDAQATDAYSKPIFAVVLNSDEDSSGLLPKNLSYKIRTIKDLPTNLFKTLDNGPYASPKDYYYMPFAQIQLCLDKSFIDTVAKPDLTFNYDLSVQQMPYPPHIENDDVNNLIARMFASFAVFAFVLPSCIETRFPSKEKAIGVNVLMTMNGVPNYMNLLSWLVSGVIYAGVYITFFVLGFKFLFSQNVDPYLYYGNTFIIWLLLMFNVAHLITFGLHVSSYLGRPTFVMVAFIFTYFGAASLHKIFLKKKIFSPIPYFGIIFPNTFIYRTFEEFPAYEEKLIGVQFSNLFTPATDNYGALGSIGSIFLLSLLGSIIHFLAAIYIYAVKPGKYGVKEQPLFFLKWLIGSQKLHKSALSDLNRNNGSNDGRRFENVAKGAYNIGIKIRNLKKVYETSFFNKSYIYALKGVSIDIYKGQITALLGHNGAGKTTLMSILTGLISSTEGTVIINDLNTDENLSEIKMNLGLCPQENMMFPDLTPMEQVRFFGLLKTRGKSKRQIEENVLAVIEKLNLSDKKNARPKTMSGGQKRRLCLAMALIGDANTLILDEPTSGMDPENRRDVWDMLLKLRGQKTIIISTHDMEEADILGDRVAIVHSGRLRCYGTAMFLKRFYGHGKLEVTLSTEPNSILLRIKSEFPLDAEVVNLERGKMVFSIPCSDEVPDILDSIESKKTSLGITGISVSLITLEQVFLKATAEDEVIPEDRTAFTQATRKISGWTLTKQQISALLEKKLTFTKKNFYTTLLVIILPLIPIFLMALNNDIVKDELKIFPLRMDLYKDSEALYTSDREELGNNYGFSVSKSRGIAIPITGESVSQAILELGINNIAKYQNDLIASAEFNKTRRGHIKANALFSDTALLSVPISLNLVTNTLVKTMGGPEYDIKVNYQKFPQTPDFRGAFSLTKTTDSIMRTTLLCAFIFPTVALFAIQPIQETVTGIKHLQRMNGVSVLSYWGVMYFVDLVVYTLMTLLALIAFSVFDCLLGVKLYQGLEIGIMFLIFMLFGINILPLVYIFSFFKKSIGTTITILSVVSVALVFLQNLLEIATLSVDSMGWLYPYEHWSLLFLPYVSFYNAQLDFYVVGLQNSRCRRMDNYLIEISCRGSYSDPCCQLYCFNGNCQTNFPYFNGYKSDVYHGLYSISTYTLYLCITPIIYFGILVLLESRIISKIIMKRSRAEPIINNKKSVDEKVKEEKMIVAREINKHRHWELPEIFNNEHLEAKCNGNKNLYMAYELSKAYGKLKAVKEVNFRVKSGECFGLLGVNGAGKSTTFRMLTGEEFPTSGTMYLNNYNFNDNESRYLSEMGYCPQTDAMLTSLDTYDHLRLMGKLRGIPSYEVDTEVNKWIDRLNLNVCAREPCGTYSGGNKRRLNIAMALIGGPSLVLLDEPTTGVDPAARRLLWKILKSCQAGGQSIILTSHSMEECEVLCNRLVIMVSGRLLCIGASEELKQRFGAGYDILIKLNPEHSCEEVQVIKRIIESNLECELRDENLGFLGYHITDPKTKWKTMYRVMNSLKAMHNSIEDFAVLSATLEQLFMKFAKSADKMVINNDQTVVNVSRP